MSSRGRGGRGRPRGRGAGGCRNRSVLFGRNQGGKGYNINEKSHETRSVSDFSSLTDVSLCDLTSADVHFESSLMKVLFINCNEIIFLLLASLSGIHRSSQIVSIIIHVHKMEGK